jgi:serine protease Do
VKPAAVIAGVLVWAAWVGAAAPGFALAAPADPLQDRRTPVVEAIARAAPSVVNISTKQVRTVEMMPRFWLDLPDIFRREFGDLLRPRRYVQNSLGSGAIISPRGYIVTNAHVVRQADEIIVTLSDETQLGADLVSADTEADLAVIKVTPKAPLTAIPMGTSSDLMIGETVIAVGNPFGYQHTVTTGVVSALDRTLEAPRGAEYKGLIQTDAPINPGNSGGPLLNIRGELIGINTAIRAGAQGLGFAIPVDRVRAIMVGLMNVRRAGQAWLGLRLRPDVAGGVEVESVDKGSPAEKARLAPGDRIESLDGRPVRDAIEFETLVLEHKVGETLLIGVRRGGRAYSAPVTLAEPPKPDGAKLARALFGLHLQTLRPDLAATMRLSVDRGLLVAGVDPASAAARIGFREGDVIVQVEQYRVTDLDGLGLLLAQVEKGDRVLFYVVRGAAILKASLEAQQAAVRAFGTAQNAQSAKKDGQRRQGTTNVFTIRMFCASSAISAAKVVTGPRGRRP